MKKIAIILAILCSSESFSITSKDKDEIDYWKREYRKSPRDSAVLFNLATSYYYAGLYKKSAKYYSKASKRKSKLNYLAGYYLALSYVELQKYDTAYKLLLNLQKRRLPKDLKLKVKEYIALFENPEANETDTGPSFLDRISLSLEANYGQNTNPGYSNSGSEDSSNTMTGNLYSGIKLINSEKQILETYGSYYQEQYASLSSSDSQTIDLGINYYLFLKKGYVSINPYQSSDSDEDSDTYVRQGGNVSFNNQSEDTYTITYYKTTTDDADLSAYAGTTMEASYTNMYSERKNEFRYTTIKLFKNDLNDTDDYYNSNQGIDVTTGITQYYTKSNLTGSLRLNYKEYVVDETLGMGRYDKTVTLSSRYTYDLSKYIGITLDASYIKNMSNWEDIEDYDPTYQVTSYALGVSASL